MRTIFGVLVLLVICTGMQMVGGAELYVDAGGWGSNGTDDAEFYLPAGIAVDADGYAYVVDGFNHRVQKFHGPTGGYGGAFGGYGEGDGQFRYPLDVAVNASGHVFVTDPLNVRVQVFTPTGGYVDQWGDEGYQPWQFMYPADIAVGPDGRVTVADPNRATVQQFTCDGTYLGTIGAYGTPADVAVDAAGTVYVADSLNQRVVRYAPNGTLLAMWGTLGAGDGQFQSPNGIAVDARGDVYVTDYVADRVQKFDPDGKFLAKWGTEGNGSGQLDGPRGVAVGNDGTVYVVDSMNSRVQMFRRVLAADFTAAPRSGYAPLAVQFADTSAGDPEAWTWAFGDGSTSHARNPAHTYAGPGTYTVTLTVDGGGAGANTMNRTGFVRVLPPLWNGLIRVEAEDYDEGANGETYSDTTKSNSGGAYRSDDVDIIEIGKGFAVADIADGEWTRYSVYSQKAANFTYPLSLRVNAYGPGRSIAIGVNGGRGGSVDVPATDGFAFVNTTVGLAPGWNDLRFTHQQAEGLPVALEFDWFVLDPAGVPATPTPTPTSSPVLAVPPCTALPTDTDGDTRYDDVNGNGRKDFADVVLYFNQMSWIAGHEPVALFDCNDNGRIDFADVVWLFNHL